MANSVRLRVWQKAALEGFLSSTKRDFLAVATPGAGKTTFALTAARHHLAEYTHGRLIVVVPTQHLKTQWAHAALSFSLHLEPGWASSQGRLPADMHGIVTTYQQVASSAATLRSLSNDAFVVFDEIHHAADDRAWGDNIRLAFERAGRRLCLSGTPFRSDTQAIPFVHYDDDQQAHPDFEYGYGRALSDGGVVRPVYFPRIDGHMEWTAPSGTFHSHTFEDEVGNVMAGQRLRTALSAEGQWLPEVLNQAHAQLTSIRRTHPNAGGLAIAIDQQHARAIAELIQDRLQVKATVATSDDPMASVRIAQFASGDDPWLVAVRMVSEGVDIPRLRVGVFATNTTTDLFFRQAIGRLVRHTRGIGHQPAYLFIPDDRRLRIKAFEIAVARRHSLRKKTRDLDEVDQIASAESDLKSEVDEQRSLFAPISSVTLGEPGVAALEDSAFDDANIEDNLDGIREPYEDDESLVIALGPPPPLAGAKASSKFGGTTGTNGISGTAAIPGLRTHQKGKLREANTNCVRELVRVTGMTHAAVNGELNRLTGIKRITEATMNQLQVRLGHAERWLSR